MEQVVDAGLRRRSLLRAIGAGAVAGGLTMGGRVAAGGRTRRDAGVLDVAIIGAGLSGLTAARDLRRAGCESFVVLEARDRVGGRMVNHDLGNGVIAEGGGQWIGPGQTAIFDLAGELGVNTFDSYYAGKTVSLLGDQTFEEDAGSGALFGDSPIVRKVNAMARTVSGTAPWNAPDAPALDRQSVADWLARQAPSEAEKINFSLSTMLTYGAPPEQLSLLHYLTLINSMDSDLGRLESMKNGAQEKRLVGGSWVLCQKLADQLADRIRLSSPVHRIAGWDGDVVTLDTASGPVRARRVIVAMSPSLCNRIAFDPPLPPQRAAMHREWPTIAHMRKAVHVYDRPFWRAKGFNGQVLDLGGPLMWSADNSPPDASVGILTGFIREGSLSADPAVAGPAIAATYARALGDEALAYSQYHEIDWGAEEWSLSCTSPYPPGFLTKYGAIMREPVGALLWSGTDMAEKHPSAMDGAIRTGHRSALSALGTLAKG